MTSFQAVQLRPAIDCQMQHPHALLLRRRSMTSSAGSPTAACLALLSAQLCRMGTSRLVSHLMVVASSHMPGQVAKRHSLTAVSYGNLRGTHPL